jgi:autotransporter-associated beta strand protein
MNSKSLLLRCALFCSALLFFSNYQAQVTVSWRTEAANGSWENGSNTCAEIGNVNSQWWYNGWGNNSARNKPDCFGSHILVFDNNHQLTMSLGTSSFNVHKLVFSSGNSSSRTIGTVGNGSINFFESSSTWPRIQNNSSAVHTINAAIVGSLNAGFNLELVPTTKSLIFGGTINNNSKSIQVYGNNTVVDADNRFVQLNGIVSGSGPLNISQFGVVKLNASNTYTGQTQIDNGELWIELNGAISSSSAIFVGNGGQLVNTAKLWLANSTGGVTFNNNVTINPGNSNTRFIGGLNSSGVNIFSGTITNNSDNGLILVADLSGGTVEFNGVLAGSKPYFTSGLGTVVISGTSSNAYNTGLTTLGSAVTVLNKSANMIAITTNATLQSGKILRTDASNQWGTGTPPLLSILSNGVFNLNNFDQKVAISSSSATASITLGSATLTIDNSLSDTYAGAISGTGGITKSNNGTLILSGTNTYSGNTIVNSGTLQLNKTGGGTLPNTNSITVNNGGTLRISSNQTLSDLTINSGGTVIVDANVQLTINGILSNSGTFTLENGATLVQGSSSTLAGTNGTYNVKQTITGAGTTTPTGRFWYLGSPVASASSSVLLANANNILKRRNEQTSQWETVSTGNLEVGKGYYLQASNGSASAGNITLTFSGGSLNNSPTASPMTISGLSRTAGQGFEGFNLVANPYPSYLDWDAVTKTDVGNTMWYRTFNSTNNTMVFDTYVAGTNGIGTNLNGAGVSNLIPPMQSFWVRVNANANPSLNNTGSLGLSNSMRAHFTSINGSTAGLKSTSNERDLFLRMNLLQANKKDQIIVYVNETATNGFDVLDGEKMMQAGMPQFYTSAAGKKITINGLNSAKKQQSLPITMELPTTGVHSFVIEDLEISNGLVWLEDKQEEIMQALEPGTVYEFYANSGINAERFVLHFQLIDNTTPINIYNEVNGSANFSGKGASVHAESAGVVVIKLPATTEGITDIQIRDAAGRLVYTGSTNTLETSVQLEQANGIYYVTLNSASGVEVRKVFVQQ